MSSVYTVCYAPQALDDLRKISNFFTINLLTIWVNRDIIQTTNPPT